MKRAVLVCLLSATAGLAPASDPARPFGVAELWVVEQMPGGTVAMGRDAIEIKDQGGCTVWWREKLTAPASISYTVTALASAPGERVSDVNCFWMAREIRSAEAPFSAANARTGKFADYDTLLTYYVGYGANNNTTTRFRRYDGTAARPLLPAHDLAAARFMLEPNRPVRIRLVARDGRAEFWRDNDRIFEFTDPSPLTAGWFALRTVNSHLRIEQLRIER